MTDTKIHVGDVGTSFLLTIVDKNGTVIDISSALSKFIYFQKPKGAILKKDAVFVTDGKDGEIQYLSVTGDIDEVGTWYMQGYVETSLGKYSASAVSFRVEQALAVGRI